jgi:hypothetical protein
VLNYKSFEEFLIKWEAMIERLGVNHMNRTHYRIQFMELGRDEKSLTACYLESIQWN